MKLEEVLPALRRGNRIRRADKDWQNDFGYVFYREKEFELLYSKSEGEDHLYSFDETDLFFNDWEIVEVKKKKVKLRDLTEKQYKNWLKYNCYKMLCVGCIFFKTPCDYGRSNCWIRNKDLYGDKFLDLEIEIDE